MRFWQSCNEQTNDQFMINISINLIFCCTGCRENYFGRLIGEIIIIILRFRVGTSKNKNIDHRLKENCTICQHKLHMKRTTYLYSVIQQCQVHSSFVFYVFYCNLKENDRIRKNTNGKKRNVYGWNQYYYYFDWPKIRIGRALTTKNQVAFTLDRCLLNINKKDTRITHMVAFEQIFTHWVTVQISFYGKPF